MSVLDFRVLVKKYVTLMMTLNISMSITKNGFGHDVREDGENHQQIADHMFKTIFGKVHTLQICIWFQIWVQADVIVSYLLGARFFGKNLLGKLVAFPDNRPP